ESLEQKALLAGDVGVEIVDGDLFISGDDLGNRIEISAGSEGEFVITGLPTEDGETTINGSAEAFVATDFTGNVFVDTGAGADEVVVGNVQLGGDLAINTGADNDTVIVGGAAAETDAASLSVDGNLLVSTGAGDDTVILGGALNDGGDLSADVALEVGGNVRVDTGDGADRVAGVGLSVDGNLALNAGTGDDQVTLGSAISLDGALDPVLVEGAEAQLDVRGSLF